MREEFIEVDRVAVELVRFVVTEESREEPREEERVSSEDFVGLVLRRRLGLRWMGEGGGLSLSPVDCDGSSGTICVMVVAAVDEMSREIRFDVPVALDRCVGFLLFSRWGCCFCAVLPSSSALFALFAFVFYDGVKQINVIVKCNLFFTTWSHIGHFISLLLNECGVIDIHRCLSASVDSQRK